MRRTSHAEIDQHGIGIDAVHFLVEVAELGGEARIDLDDLERVRPGLPEQLDIERAVVEPIARIARSAMP
jgi:hypothetical protein